MGGSHEHLRLEAGVHVVGQVVIREGLERDRGQRERTRRRALHAERRVDELEVRLGRFELVRRDGAGLVEHLVRGEVHGGAADRRANASRRCRDRAARSRCRSQHLDVFDSDAERVRDDHRPRRLVGLAVRRRSGDDLYGAGRQYAHRRRFPAAADVVAATPAPGSARARTSRRTKRCRHRGASLLPVGAAVCAARRAARRSRPFRGPGRARARSRPNRRRARRDCCTGTAPCGCSCAAAARPDRHRSARGQRVDRPLDRVGGLRTPRAPVGVGGCPVREDRRARERVRRNVVDAVIEERAEQRDAGRDELKVRTHVGEQVHTHRGDAAVGVGRELDVLDHARGPGPSPARSRCAPRSSAPADRAASRARSTAPPRRRR